MKKKILLITLYGLLFDQIIKFLVSKYITNVTIIPNFISLIYAENDGVAFSMLSGSRIIIIIISIILLSFLTYYMNKDYVSKKKDDILMDISYGLLFGGILGNLLDRIIRGIVIDYISINIIRYHFPIFNLADVMITIGVIIMIIRTLKSESKNT